MVMEEVFFFKEPKATPFEVALDALTDEP